MPVPLPAGLTIDAAGRRVSVDPRDSRFYQDPYRAYAAIRAVRDTFYWEEQRMWCFMNAADVGAMLKDSRLGREPPAGSGVYARLPALEAFHRHSLLELEPPAHSRLRSLVGSAFFGRVVERLRPAIAGHAEALIDAFAAAGHAELIGAFATPIPVTVIMRMLGVPPDMARQFLEWSHRMVAVYELARTAAIEDAAEAATREFTEFLRGYIRLRRDAPADDLISLLIAAESSGDRLSEEEMVATCILLLNAGHEATVHALGNAVKVLLEERVDLSAAFATPESTAAVVEECLRFDPPLHLFTRFVKEAGVWNGVRLSAGDSVALLYGAANRDPARFPDPDRFDPARHAPPHLSFGGGIHFCLGAPLARLELQIALPILFRRLPALRLSEAPNYSNRYHFHGLTTLHAAW